MKSSCGKTGARFSEKFRTAARRACAVLEQLKDRRERLTAFYAALCSEENRATFANVRQNAGRILRELMPKKGGGYVRFGTGDPYTTGQVMEAAALLYPYYGEQIDVIPVFDEAGLEMKGDVRGRVRLISLLIPLWKLYADKNLRELIGKLRNRNEI